MMKVTFVMGEPDAKKHSTRFDFVPGSISPDESETTPGFAATATGKAFKPTFYVPAPFMDAKRIRVTIESLD
jgi:hypothetical protein